MTKCRFYRRIASFSSLRASCLHFRRYLTFFLRRLRAAVVTVLSKWARYRTADEPEDVALWGSYIIYYLVTEDTRGPWLATSAERVLRGIKTDPEASVRGSLYAGWALRGLALGAK